MLPERAEDLEVAVAGEPRLDATVLADPETVQGGGDGAFRHVRARRAHARLELFERQVIETRGSERGQAGVPRGEPFGQLNDSAVDAGDTAHCGGVPPAVLEHHVAAPGLADENGTREAEGLDHGPDIGDHRVHVVTGLRRVRAAVAPLIQRDDRVAAGPKILGDAVPQAEVRREAVDQHERRRAGISLASLHVEPDVRRHLDPKLGGARLVRLALGMTHGRLHWTLLRDGRARRRAAQGA